MKNEIIEKTNDIREGFVPEGYKQNKNGVAPIDWTEQMFGEIANITMGQSPTGDSYNSDGIGVPLINGPTEFTKKYPVVKQWTSKPTKLCKVNDILICVRGSSTGRINISDGEYCIGRGVAAISSTSKSNTDYVRHLLNLIVLKLLELTTGSTFPNLSSTDLREFEISTPSSIHQQKIAEILSTWDNAIELREQLVEEKKKQKMGLMKMLLTGKVRLSGFDGEWKDVRLGDLIKSKTMKTTENNQYLVLSCTKDGIFMQSEHFNKQIASENNIGYKILNKGELVFSPMNLWLGGIDISSFEIGIVSPAYKVYSVDYSIIGENYLRNILRSEYMIQKYDSISQKGASVVRRNLSIPDFEDLLISIPLDKLEMDSIDKLIGLASKEVELLETTLENIKIQKKGLMQLLLTGIVEVQC